MIGSPCRQTCNFDNLPWLIVVCHFFLPMLAIPLTFLLIPKAKITDSIEIDASGKFVGVTPKEEEEDDDPAKTKATTEGVVRRSKAPHENKKHSWCAFSSVVDWWNHVGMLHLSMSSRGEERRGDDGWVFGREHVRVPRWLTIALRRWVTDYLWVRGRVGGR